MNTCGCDITLGRLKLSFKVIMKVINLLGSDFTNACQKLKAKVTDVYEPDLVIGVATGGAVVLEHMGFESDKKTVIIKRQRPFTKVKRNIKLEVWLPYFPRWVNDIIRELELRFNEYCFNKNNRKLNDKKSELIILQGSVEDFVGAKRILMVDDSVDSGATLTECIDFVRSHLSPDAEIRTASINVTFKNPVIPPTYTLYPRTIIRYPWASDVRGNNEKNSL